MTDDERNRFDEILEAIMDGLPPRIADLLKRAPVIVEDEPTPELLAELGINPDNEILCGLHTGTPITQRSLEQGPELPEMIHLFRIAIVEEAGGWERLQDESGQWWGGIDAIAEQIRITLLHEMGHHFGLEDEDLEELGYG